MKVIKPSPCAALLRADIASGCVVRVVCTGAGYRGRKGCGAVLGLEPGDVRFEVAPSLTGSFTCPSCQKPTKATFRRDGHGHVYPRLDGSLARCGGPGACVVCSREAAAAYRTSARAEP